MDQAQAEKLLDDVNSHVNSNINYKQGLAGWQLDNLPDGGEGDCDSIARTKGERLVQAGFPKDNLFIQTLKLDDGQDHAVLRVHMPDDTARYLDLNNSGIAFMRDSKSVSKDVYSKIPITPKGFTMIPYSSWDKIKEAGKSQHPADNPDKLVMR